MDLTTKVKSEHNHLYPYGYFENGLKVIEYASEYGLGLLCSVIVRRDKFKGYYYKFHGSNDWLWIYSNIRDFKVYGDNRKLVIYGTHKLQDSANSNTHVQCMLTMTYIYDYIISKIEDLETSFKVKSKAKASSVFIYFMAIVSKEKFNQILSETNIYSDYLKSKYQGKIVFDIYLSIPVSFRIFLYKVLKKISFYKPPF